MDPRALAGRLKRKVKKKIKKLLLPFRLTSMAIENVLVGGESGIEASQYARLINDLRRPSTKFIEGPHVTFLRQYQEIGESILDTVLFEKTSYFKNAQTCMDLTGHYFWARRDEELRDVAAQFISRFEDRVEKTTFVPRPGQSAIDDPVIVQPVAFSRLYSMSDGNHRLAMDYVKGKAHAMVLVMKGSTTTPLQQMLMDVLWTDGRFELYQPVDLPECQDRWAIVRKCTDRLAMFKRFLDEADISGMGKTYLDIGSYYGWFVRQMTRLGFDSYGIERDPIAADIGRLVYGNRPDQILIGECARLLDKSDRVYDVVSIQSVLHHFAMGRGRVTPEQLIRLVDKATGSVMFFETGQSHEAWFRESLHRWTPDFIEDWLRRNTTFSRVCRLGVDEDSVGRYSDNYGRTMFACMR